MASRGVDVLGVDFNASMLQRLRASAPDFPALVGDALRLPVARGTVGPVVVSNVLHLLEGWRSALAEIALALRGDGCLAVNLGAGGVAPLQATEVRREFLAHLPKLRPTGPSSEEELAAASTGLGFEAQPPVDAHDVTTRTIREVIERLELNPFAWPRGPSKDLLSQAAAN